MNKANGNKRKNYKKALITLLFILGFSVFLYQQNNMLTTTNIIIESKELPEAFNGYTILHLSDLHGKSFGRDQKKLLRKIREVHPDIIVFTGDLIDARRYNEKHSLKLMEQLVNMTDVYYVTGNHEASSGKFTGLEENLLDIGVEVLRNTSVQVEKGNGIIYIIGMDDPLFGYSIGGIGKSFQGMLETVLEEIPNQDSFKILLSHRPELFPLYVEKNIDVTFAGHAHGGQFRLPFVGGLVAPGQGVLPQYTAGAYKEDKYNMIVSRGLGNSLFPQRLFNRPEIVVVELQTVGGI